MKRNPTILVSTLCFLLTAIAHVQAQMPSLGSVEAWTCTMNEGQSMSDLMEVVEDWNDWSDDNEMDSYSAWVLTPIFNADTDFVDSGIWFGYAPSFTEMGKILQTWATKGGELNDRFNDVWTCSSHSEFATLLVRPPTDGPTSAVASFSDCKLSEGSSTSDLLAAAAKWNSYLDENASTVAIAYHFPGHGNPVDMTTDLKISMWRPNLESYGRDADLYVNGGGFQASSAIFGDIMTCDSGRMYNASLVRAGQTQ